MCGGQYGKELNDTHRNDDSHPKHGTQHPFAVLVNLLTLDIVPCKIRGTNSGDSQEIDRSLHAEVTSHTSASHYHSTNVSKEHKEHHNITNKMMHRNGFLGDVY